MLLSVGIINVFGDFFDEKKNVSQISTCFQKMQTNVAENIQKLAKMSV